MSEKKSESYYVDLIERIERVAKENDISIRHICERAGVSHVTFFRWKNNRPETLQKLEQIADALQRAVESKDNQEKS